MKSRWWSRNRRWNSGLQKGRGKNGRSPEEKKVLEEKGSDSPDSSTKVWEVKEDQKAAAVQRLLMKKVKEAKEKEAREAEEKKRKEEDKKRSVGGDVQADRDKKKREEEAAKRKLAEEKGSQGGRGKE